MAGATPSSPLLPAAALLLNALAWGLSWIPLQALYRLQLHPLLSITLVFGAALGLLLLWRPASLRRLLRSPQLLGVALAAGLTNIGFNWAVTIGDVVRVVLLFYLMPLWSIGLAWLLLRERPTRAALLRLALALAGVALVLKRPGQAWPLPAGLADWLALMGGFCFALNNVLLRRWRQTPGDARALAMFGGGFVMSGALALAGGTLHTVPAIPVGDWVPWVALLAIAVFSGNLALQYGAARLPAQVTALIMLSEVLFASVSAVLLGAAQPSPATWAGGALIVLAALLSIRPARLPRPA